MVHYLKTNLKPLYNSKQKFYRRKNCIFINTVSRFTRLILHIILLFVLNLIALLHLRRLFL